MAAQSAGTGGGDVEPVVMVFAEPAPYCCPPLGFARREVQLWRSSEPVASFHAQRPWVAVRTNDAGTTRPSDVAGLLLRKPGIWEGVDRPTPMSWANKPFHVTAADDPIPPD